MDALLGPSWRKIFFIAAWGLAVLVEVFLLLARDNIGKGPVSLITLAILLGLLVFFLLWIRPPLLREPLQRLVRPGGGRFTLLVIMAVLVLMPLRALIGTFQLFLLPLIAVIALVILRPAISRRELLYAGGLALVAALTGLAAGWIKNFSPLAWGGLQLFLVIPGLLAGWAILKKTCLLEQGVGRSRFLQSGALSALKGFGWGVLLSLPWALGMLLTGSADGETWVKAGWQPLIAIQPGISEEAWGRILVVPLLYLLFHRAAGARPALTAALLVQVYWFAMLHGPGDLASLPGALITGTLFILPVSYITLYRDLESGIGMHFAMDAVKFLFALLVINM